MAAWLVPELVVMATTANARLPAVMADRMRNFLIAWLTYWLPSRRRALCHCPFLAFVSCLRPSVLPTKLGHPSLVLAISALPVVAMCRWRFIYGAGERIGSLGWHVFPGEPSY